MKKYITPDMKALAFAAMEDISADYSPSVTNDGSFGDWDTPSTPENG